MQKITTKKSKCGASGQTKAKNHFQIFMHDFLPEEGFLK